MEGRVGGGAEEGGRKSKKGETKITLRKEEKTGVVNEHRDGKRQIRYSG